jgi:hypothetical protein
MRGMTRAAIVTSVVTAATLLTPSWSDQRGVSFSVESAQAVMGRPLTPLSGAGVARRQYRRSVYGTGVGAGLAGAAAIGTAAAIGASPYYGGYYGGGRYYGGSPYYTGGAWDANAYYGGAYAADPYYANAYDSGTYIGGPKTGLWRSRTWYGW